MIGADYGIFEGKLIPPLRKGRPGGVDFLCLIINHPQPLLSKEGGNTFKARI